ncbi:PAS domain-containing sensor histidine kinase [Ferrovibrio sp.]|uniref:PAS domain-containing sensor histidine kinase n=1 Tax=Ferrovibrio sp. TaxID=1917215 RepID=UPI001B7A5F01|nr:PAS domain-containing sensor histidine kinase [Ferrovibrio sp.]MBP7062625.1 PAS domain-containing sensor histidine kinase [Ferrovibrio sp.]
MIEPYLQLFLRAGTLGFLLCLMLWKRHRFGKDIGYAVLAAGLGVIVLANALEGLVALYGPAGSRPLPIILLYPLGVILVGFGILRWSGWLERVQREAEEAKTLQAQLEGQRLQLLESHRVGRLGYWVADPGIGSITWSGVMADTLGLDPARRLLFREAEALLHPEDTALVQEALRQTYRSGQRFDLQVRLRDQAGNFHWFALAGVPQRDAEGKRWLFGVVQDIDAAKRAELERAGLSTLLQGVIDAIPCMIVVKDADLRYLFANAYARRLFLPEGHAATSLVGMRYADIAPSDLALLTEQEDRAVLAGQVMPFTEVQRRYRSDGADRWWMAKVALRSNPDGAPDHLLTVALDISALKQAEETARQAQREVEYQATQLQELAEQYRLECERAVEASRAKSDFLASMSHELRTPLNAVIGFAEIMTSQLFGPLVPKYQECSEDILASGRHLLSLINDILDMARIEAGRYELDIRAADAISVLEASLRLVKLRAQHRGVNLEYDIAEDLGDVVVDAQALKQIAINLLTNAVKFTHSGGDVRLAALREGEGLKLSVSDTGIGIKTEHQKKIFEPFWQAEGPLARRHEGSGLGLAITRQLVELHHGRIEVRSIPERGTNVTVWLYPAPRAADLSAAALLPPIQD